MNQASRGTQTWPLTDPGMLAGFFFLEIDRLGPCRMEGRAEQPFCGRSIPFVSLDDAVFKMDAMMDEAGTPEMSRPKKFFRLSEGGGLNTMYLKELERCMAAERLDGLVRRAEEYPFVPDGKALNFIVTVSARTGGSWQGSVVWVRNRGKNQKESFGTVLELLRLIWSAATAAGSGAER